MLISTRSRYGLRTLAEMARRGKNAPVALSELSEAQDVSTRYLEQIFGKLRASGLVKGRRGPGGGYVLSRSPESITLLEVINCLEKGFLSTNCLDTDSSCTRRTKAPKACPRVDGCVTRKLWAAMRDSCYGILRANTLADLAADRLREV